MSAGRVGPGGNHQAARERRAAYIELRRSGLGKWEAGREAGTTDRGTIWRYEQWYQAEVRGETAVQVR